MRITARKPFDCPDISSIRNDSVVYTLFGNGVRALVSVEEG